MPKRIVLERREVKNRRGEVVAICEISVDEESLAEVLFRHKLSFDRDTLKRLGYEDEHIDVIMKELGEAITLKLKQLSASLT